MDSPAGSPSADSHMCIDDDDDSELDSLGSSEDSMSENFDGYMMDPLHELMEPLHGLDGIQDIAPFPQVLFPNVGAGQVGQDGQNGPVIQWHPNVGPAAWHFAPVL